MPEIEENFALILSRLLWDHGAIEVKATKPFFRLSSGEFTPIYINCRLLISDPATRGVILSFAHYLCHRRALKIDSVAGGETAGIPFGAWLAQLLDKPFVYVRKKAKSHGIGTRIEGTAHGRVLLVEDLITDGGSKVGFLEGIREVGLEVSDCLVVFDREQDGTKAMARLGVRLHSLVSLSSSLQTGLALGTLSQHDVSEVEGYLSDTTAWQHKQGLQPAIDREV